MAPEAGDLYHDCYEIRRCRASAFVRLEEEGDVVVVASGAVSAICRDLARDKIARLKRDDEVAPDRDPRSHIGRHPPPFAGAIEVECDEEAVGSGDDHRIRAVATTAIDRPGGRPDGCWLGRARS